MTDKPASGIRNLLILHTVGAQDVADWKAIQEKIRNKAPDIDVRIADSERPNPITRKWQIRWPSLVFCPTHSPHYRPLGGTLIAGKRMSKLEQLERFDAAGLPTPRTILFSHGMSFDPGEWGDYVVTKPIHGSHGANIRLARLSEVAELARDWRPHLGSGVVIQAFIDHTDATGHLSDYRIVTMLGRPLMVQQRRLVTPRPSLETMLKESPFGIAMNRVSHRRTRAYVDAPDVYAFAEKIAAAFPDVACLGIDIIRERETGKLYVLEVNPGGNVWQFSSDFTKKFWPPEDRAGAYDQFDALELAADLLIERTRREAS
jgi:hypothetical protein